MISTEQIASRLKVIGNDEKFFRQPLYLAGKTAMSMLVVRVFTKGQDINGNTYQYADSKKGIYMSDENLRRNGNHLGKPNAKGRRKKIKTTYFESYKAMKKAQGFDNSFMNFRLTNRLQSDVTNSNIPKSSSKVGTVTDNTFTKGGFLELFVTVNNENKKKVEGINSKGKIIAWSKQEFDEFSRVFVLEVAKKIFN